MVFVSFQCDNFFFVDLFTFTLQADVNATMMLPSGYTSDMSVSLVELKTDYNSLSNTYQDEPWFPYVSSGINAVQYSVAGSTGTGN